MTEIGNKIGILKDAFMGNLMKLKVLYDVRLRKALTLSSRQDAFIIVSLTTYGKRVNGSVVYTVYSLLRQIVRPERVVLWLDEKEYNAQNLPSDLRFLCKYGLDIRFGKDIGSYTKIIHSLSAFSDKHIITADDDLYYTRHFVEEFVEAHRQHPQADDIWLYVMGLRCQAEKRMLTNSHIAYYHTDLLRQYLTRDRLTATNRFGGENDTQLQALLAHYDIRVKN